MTIRYLYILLFFFVVQIVTAQNSYSEGELKNFVEVYMTYKKDIKRNTDTDKKYFEKYNVTTTRYREISQSRINDKTISLSANENQLLAELKKQNDLLKKSNQQVLEKICLDHNLSILKYSSMLNAYKKDIHFQRSLKPHFETYINGLK